MLFKENKAKKESAAQEEQSVRKPAWTDDTVGQLKVDIASQSRLRKLKTSEKEDSISGVEFSKRLKQQHESMTNGSELFNWAQPNQPEQSTADNTRKGSLISAK